MRGKTSAEPNADDNEEYYAHLGDVCLYVKEAQMVQPIYDSLILKFQKEPLFYHYRKIVVKAYSIHGDSQVFESNNLWPENESCVKIHFAIVETKAMVGDYKK